MSAELTEIYKKWRNHSALSTTSTWNLVVLDSNKSPKEKENILNEVFDYLDEDDWGGFVHGHQDCAGPITIDISFSEYNLAHRFSINLYTLKTNGNNDIEVNKQLKINFKIWMLFLKRLGIEVDYTLKDTEIEYDVPLNSSIWGKNWNGYGRLTIHTFVRYFYNKYYYKIACKAIQLKIDNPTFTEWKCLEIAHISSESIAGYNSGFGLLAVLKYNPLKQINSTKKVLFDLIESGRRANEYIYAVSFNPLSFLRNININGVNINFQSFTFLHCVIQDRDIQKSTMYELYNVLMEDDAIKSHRYMVELARTYKDRLSVSNPISHYYYM